MDKDISYDAEFWPERSDVEEALETAEAIRAFVLERMPRLDHRSGESAG
ncbi:MAG: hypothetical protein AB1503_09460 [Bacillota bacterium]|nr:hypothetical protein [Bacillota bacterium]